MRDNAKWHGIIVMDGSDEIEIREGAKVYGALIINRGSDFRIRGGAKVFYSSAMQDLAGTLLSEFNTGADGGSTHIVSRDSETAVRTGETLQLRDGYDNTEVEECSNSGPGNCDDR